MSLLDLGPVIFGDIDRQIAWFQSKNLLPRQATCSSCGAAMVLQQRNDIQDKKRYGSRICAYMTSQNYFLFATIQLSRNSSLKSKKKK